MPRERGEVKGPSITACVSRPAGHAAPVNVHFVHVSDIREAAIGMARVRQAVGESRGAVIVGGGWVVDGARMIEPSHRQITQIEGIYFVTVVARMPTTEENQPVPRGVCNGPAPAPDDILTVEREVVGGEGRLVVAHRRANALKFRVRNLEPPQARRDSAARRIRRDGDGEAEPAPYGAGNRQHQG